MKSPDLIKQEIATLERKLEYAVGELTEAISGGRYVEASYLIQSLLWLRTRIETLKWVIGEEQSNGQS